MQQCPGVQQSIAYLASLTQHSADPFTFDVTRPTTVAATRLRMAGSGPRIVPYRATRAESGQGSNRVTNRVTNRVSSGELVRGSGRGKMLILPMTHNMVILVIFPLL